MRLSDFCDATTTRQSLDDLHSVETRPLYFWDQDPDGLPELRRMPNHRLIFNTVTREPVVPATSLYAILPHAEAFGRILDCLRADLDPRVYIENLENSARIWLLFPFSENEEQIIGVRITNSYDMSVSLQGDLVVWMPEDYALVFSRVQDLKLPPLALPHRAAAFSHLEEKVQAFVDGALGGESWMAVEMLMDAARADWIRFGSHEEKEELLRGIFGKKLAGRLADLVPDETTRWELFTVVARAAHEEDLTPHMREIHRSKAEIFLHKVGYDIF